jgi:hypothetical protein
MSKYVGIAFGEAQEEEVSSEQVAKKKQNLIFLHHAKFSVTTI